jgi:hypothetical protein
MQIKNFIWFIFLLLSFNGWGQVHSDKAILDSLRKNDELLKLFESWFKPTSYLQLNVGVGNKLFGTRNNALNALQIGNKLIFTTSAGYFHKSGFGIGATGFLLNEKGNTGFYQYSLTPSYEYLEGKSFGATVSYTRYLIPDKYNLASSPIQNDFYAAAILKKPWIRPGLAIDYSMGDYHEIINVDTTFKRQNQSVVVKYTDTINTHLQSFAVTAFGEHSFKAYGIFSDGDAINFTLQLLANFDYNNYAVTHKSSAYDYITFSKNKRKRILKPSKVDNTVSDNGAPDNGPSDNAPLDNSTFMAESIGFNLNANYLIGKFNIEPAVYLDYYLPTTNSKRFTQILNLQVGYRF